MLGVSVSDSSVCDEDAQCREYVEDVEMKITLFKTLSQHVMIVKIDLPFQSVNAKNSPWLVIAK